MDLHVHLGSAGGVRPVKVTAAAGLTLPNILAECAHRKGIDIVGVVDAHTRGALADLQDLLERGALQPLPGGGLRYEGLVTVIPGAEVELVIEGRPAHFIAYVPSWEALRGLAAVLASRMKNPALSTQRCTLAPEEFVRLTDELGGVAVPAHVFTPHKGIYGTVAARLADVFGPEVLALIPAVELGLSADTAMADRISELHGKAFLSNSDAHSPDRIGREYNALRLAKPTFAEVRTALAGLDGRRILANYGLDPRLGKYHRTFCLPCDAACATDEPLPVLRCPRCGGDRVVTGVLDRLLTIADLPPGVHPPGRPPYRRQVPLQFVPGLGKRGIDRLIAAFGSEMAVLHRARRDDLAAVAGETVAARIIAAREGGLSLDSGGGGRYGRVRLPTEA